MRVKLALATVVGLLLCSLATMEFPELVNLIDDSSNDFSLVVFVKGAPTAVKVGVRTLHEERRSAPAGREAIFALLRTDLLIQPAQIAADMLDQLCVHRT